MDLNFYSFIKFALPISERMVQRGTGRIVIIGDPMVTQSTIPGMAPYACSKWALEALAMQMRTELSAHNIKVHYFLPQQMSTNFLHKQKQQYPLVTKETVKNWRATDAEYMAKRLLSGISMNEFIIGGSKTITCMATLKAQYKLMYNIFFAPFAICIRKYEDMRVND